MTIIQQNSNFGCQNLEKFEPWRIKVIFVYIFVRVDEIVIIFKQNGYNPHLQLKSKDTHMSI